MEHQIFRFAKMILRDRCSTSHDLASIFSGRRSTLDRWSGKIPKHIGTSTRLSALHFIFPFVKEVSQNCFVFAVVKFKILMLSSSKIEEVSRICFVFHVVKFKNCRLLVELFRFYCCQPRKMRKSRRIASFSSLQIDTGIDRQTDTERDRERKKKIDR